MVVFKALGTFFALFAVVYFASFFIKCLSRLLLTEESRVVVGDCGGDKVTVGFLFILL